MIYNAYHYNLWTFSYLLYKSVFFWLLVSHINPYNPSPCINMRIYQKMFPPTQWIRDFFTYIKWIKFEVKQGHLRWRETFGQSKTIGLQLCVNSQLIGTFSKQMWLKVLLSWYFIVKKHEIVVILYQIWWTKM